MVHALREIHNLLKPDGALIDIRPNGTLNKFIRPYGDGEFFIGYMHETNDYIEYHQAADAVKEVVSAGLFEIEKESEFEFRNYADSFTELKNYLHESWSNSVIKDDVAAEAKRLDDKYGVGKVFLREEIYIGFLRPI